MAHRSQHDSLFNSATGAPFTEHPTPSYHEHESGADHRTGARFTDGLHAAAKPTGGDASLEPAEATLGEMADFLRSGYWGGITRKFNLGDNGSHANSGVLEYNISGFAGMLGMSDGNGLSAPRQDLVREAFKLYGAVLGIDFVETASNRADFFFTDAYDGAFASVTGYRSGIEYAVVNVAANWFGGISSYNSYTLQTFLHEIGHALGLGHLGDYNGTASYPDGAGFANDSWQASMMSYFDQAENSTIAAVKEYLQTPMSADWIALDDIYGGDRSGGKTFGIANAFAGNTIWGFNSTVSSDESDIWANYLFYGSRTASTLIDAGGIDTLDVSGFHADQRIDLTVTTRDAVAATASDIGGSIGNLTLAAGTVIENAKGGAGDDVFAGNAADNVFWGNAGADVFADSFGSDRYLGGRGSDLVSFAASVAEVAVSLVEGGLEIVGGALDTAVDFVADSVEWLSFAGERLSFAALAEAVQPGTLPDLAITGVLDDHGTLTGMIADGGLTDDAAPTLSGTLGAGLTPGQSVAVFRDGAAIGAAKVEGTDWSFADSGLSDGRHDYSVQVIDAGAEGKRSTGFAIVLDTAAPVVTVKNVVTSDARPALHGTIDDASAALTLSVDGQSLDLDNPGKGQWSLPKGALAALTPGSYDVTLSAVDAAGNLAVDGTSGELVVEASAATVNVVEFGRVAVSQSDPSEWHRISFSGTIADAVVVMGPPTSEGRDPTTVRVRDVSDTGFEFQLREYDYLDGSHGTETLGWMAASAGTYDAGGLTVTAGTVTAANAAPRHVAFDDAFAAAPVVLTQVVSANDAAAVLSRVSRVDADGFVFALQEEEAADQKHLAEKVDYIALEIGDGAAFDTALTANAVRHRDYSVSFETRSPGDGVFLAGMQTRDGGDPATLRLKSLTDSRATIFVEEEQSANREIRHTTEAVGYLSADEGAWMV